MGRHRQDSETHQNLRHLRRLHLLPFLSCFASSSPIACPGQTESSSAWAACGAFSSSLAWQGDDPAFLLTRGSPAAQNSQQKSPGGRDSTQHLFRTDWEQISRPTPVDVPGSGFAHYAAISRTVVGIRSDTRNAAPCWGRILFCLYPAGIKKGRAELARPFQYHISVASDIQPVVAFPF